MAILSRHIDDYVFLQLAIPSGLKSEYLLILFNVLRVELLRSIILSQAIARP